MTRGVILITRCSDPELLLPRGPQTYWTNSRHSGDTY